MIQFQRLLVALDLTEMDEVLIQYVAELSRQLNIEKIYFIYVVKSLELSEEMRTKYPELLAPIDESCKKQIQDNLNKHLPKNFSIPYEIDVEEGNASELILKWAKVKEVDIVLLGKKSDLKGSGVRAQKIAKLTHCSVVFVPEEQPRKLQKIIVPIDFSEDAKLALGVAKMLVEKNNAPEVMCLHVYNVPMGYHASGKSYEEFAAIMKENSKKDYQKFIGSVKEFDTNNITDYYVLNEGSKDIDEEIYHFALDKNADAIMIGSRGKTSAAHLLLGSTAEKLLHFNYHIPVFMIKDKGKNIGFLEALLKI
jgi:nucleotide-binding universal stress UspA family protein